MASSTGSPPTTAATLDFLSHSAKLVVYAAELKRQTTEE